MPEDNKLAATPQASDSAPAKNVQLDAHLNAQIDALLAGRFADPFALLGPHPMWPPAGNGWVVRFFRPGAADASVLLQGVSEPIPARRLRPEGFFEATLPDSQRTAPAPSSYRIRYRTGYGETVETFDAYAFPYLLSEFDLHLMGEGRHYDTYEKLGSHLRTLEGVRGVHFAVWAPSAQRVSLVGDFNRWDGRVNPMRARGSSGIWELFVPELGEGAIYKYEIIGALFNEPYRVARCGAAELEVPEGAEIVIEGKILNDVREPEGPFSEFTGYASYRSTENVFVAERIQMRRDAMFHSIASGTASDHILISCVAREGEILNSLRRCPMSLPCTSQPSPAAL